HSAGDPGFLGVAFDRRHPHDALLQRPRPRHILVTTFARTFHWGHPRCGTPRLTPTPPSLHLSFPGRAYALIFREFPTQHGMPTEAWIIPAITDGTAQRFSACARAVRSWSQATARSRWARRWSSRMRASCAVSRAVR